MAARFPSKVKNPCVHLIVCFGPFLGAERRGRHPNLCLLTSLSGLAPVAPVVPDLLFELWLISTVPFR